jgi:hypothetical protein
MNADGLSELGFAAVQSSGLARERKSLRNMTATAIPPSTRMESKRAVACVHSDQLTGACGRGVKKMRSLVLLSLEQRLIPDDQRRAEKNNQQRRRA